jgi:hypothetical protein
VVSQKESAHGSNSSYIRLSAEATISGAQHAFPSVCGFLALNEQYAMPETVIEVSLENLKSIGWLEASWKELEARVTHSFFLSWLWIGTWLRHIPESAQAQVHELWLGTRQLGTFKILYMAAVSLTARAVFSMRGMAGPSPGWSAMCWLFRTASHAGNAATTSWLVAVGTSLIWLTGSIQ